MLRYYLKSPPLKKYYSFKKELAFFIKNKHTHTDTHTHKKYASASDWWKNTKSRFKENARNFSKNSTTQQNITILRN